MIYSYLLLLVVIIRYDSSVDVTKHKNKKFLPKLLYFEGIIIINIETYDCDNK
jgi:hypothetical protein